MKIKNYYDNFNFVFFGIYFIICLIFITIILVLNVSATYFVFGVLFLIIISILMIFFYIRWYVLEENYILINAGFIKKKIPYTQIKKCYIEKSINPFYSSSYKRIALKLKKGNIIYISPVKMDSILLQIIRKAEKWSNT